MRSLRSNIAALLSALCLLGTVAEAQRPTPPPPVTTATRPQRTGLRDLPPEVTEEMVRAHSISPQNVNDVRIEADDDVEASPVVAFSTIGTPRLSIEKFVAAIHGVLKDSVTGYVLQLRYNGNPIRTEVYEWAQTPSDQSKAWNADTRMHVASVSKYLTAVGLVKTLEAKGISYDAPIIGYLPDYWAKGSNIDKITFRHLLRHTSGFATTGTSYAAMKGEVAQGVTTVPSAGYRNMNYGIMRILIPIINGNIQKGASFSDDAAMNDKTWDVSTLHYFRGYMQSNVFTPAGVTSAYFKPLPAFPGALGYRFADAQPGWDSGDLSSVAGGAGWRLSMNELLKVMDHVRRRNTILSPATAQYMLDNKFGNDRIIPTPAGKMYSKMGKWIKSCVTDGDCKTEQSIAYFLPRDMEVGLFVNSPIGKLGAVSLRNLMNDAYIKSLVQ